ncbi:hypothetical protein, partial [Xanthomonas vasicola]
MIGFGGFLSIQRSDRTPREVTQKYPAPFAATRCSSSPLPLCADAIRDGLINATGKRSNRIRRA